MDLSTRTVRELIVELKHIEDALRGSFPITLPEALRNRVLARQEEICAELRRRFGGETGAPVVGTDGIPVLAPVQDPESPLPEPA